MFKINQKYLIKLSDGRELKVTYMGISHIYKCCVCDKDQDTFEFKVYYTEKSAEIFTYGFDCLPLIIKELPDNTNIYNHKDIFEYTNPHPTKKATSDCVVRAFTIALNKDYLEVRRDLNKLKREMGYQNYKDNKFLNKLLSKYDSYTFQAVAGQPRIKGFDFVKHFPIGNFILSMGRHLVACVDGVIKDTWDSSRRTVYKAYKIEENPKGINTILNIIGTDFYNVKN